MVRSRVSGCYFAHISPSIHSLLLCSNQEEQPPSVPRYSPPRTGPHNVNRRTHISFGAHPIVTLRSTRPRTHPSVSMHCLRLPYTHFRYIAREGIVSTLSPWTNRYSAVSTRAIRTTHLCAPAEMVVHYRKATSEWEWVVHERYMQMCSFTSTNATRKNG